MIFNYVFAERSSNPLLELCLDGSFKSWLPKPTLESLPDLLQCCLAPKPFEPFLSSNANSSHSKGFTLERLEDLMRICQTPGCDVNVQSSKGSSAMHFLVQGNLANVINW